MLPFGRLRKTPGTQSQVTSRWLADLESAGCEVTRESASRLSVLVPGPDATFLSSEGVFALQRLFWDRMTITVAADGTARFRLVYFSPALLLLHGIVAALFVVGTCLGTEPWLQEPARFAAGFAAMQSIPLLATLLGFRIARESILRQTLAR